MPKKSKLVFGAGVNDADYAVQAALNGERGWCPFYRAWVKMIRRCYDAKFQLKRPTYIDCSVCDEWLTFSSFKSWMERKDWQGKELDKDLLVKGNKVYSPDTCVFVDKMTNMFTTDSGASRGEWPLGVTYHKGTGRLQAQCKNPFTKKNDYLGNFTWPSHAHLAWKRRKHELACQLAELQTDERAAEALRRRYMILEDLK